MKFMIHACPNRGWYVEEFLVPSLMEQGIEKDDILVWMDSDGKGNLFSCMESFEFIRNNPGGTWHLQDDVVISRYFARDAKWNDDGLVCAFCGKDIGPDPERVGTVRPKHMWFSFPCIRIPNTLAGECADWFYMDASKREFFRERVEKKKSDDYFFLNFLKETYPLMVLTNLKPNLVDHIDYVIGGSTINQARERTSRAVYFVDEWIVDELEAKINQRGK